MGHFSCRCSCMSFAFMLTTRISRFLTRAFAKRSLLCSCVQCTVSPRTVGDARDRCSEVTHRIAMMATKIGQFRVTGNFTYLSLSSFPKCSKTIRLRISLRE